LLKHLKLITGEIVAVDGAYLRANASKNTLIMKKTVKKDIAKINEDIKNYMTILETTDKENSEVNNRTDKDANVMSKPAHNLMAYNSQIAVDNTYKFIVNTDISTNGHDLDQ